MIVASWAVLAVLGLTVVLASGGFGGFDFGVLAVFEGGCCDY